MSSNQFLSQTTSGIATLQPYLPGKPVSELERELGICDAIKLASNENPLGPSPKVLKALQQEFSELARYPDGGAFALREALANKHGVAADCITIGNGSNDVLDMIARVFLAPGRESLFSQHAFAVYPLSSMAVGASLKMAAAKDFGHDLEAMQALLSIDTGVVWIANPNNPTGTWLTQEALYTFIKSVPADTIIVLDEAYYEYVGEEDYPDASQWLSEFPNLIVTRTFSKAYGLASMRVGYGLSHPDVADLLNRVRQPFNVNSFAQAAAIAALNDAEHLAQVVDFNRQGLLQLSKGFAALGLEYIPSVGNFITLNVGRSAAEVDAALLKLGVITRPVENYGLQNCLRVTVGLEDENTRLLKALETVL